VIVWNMIIYKCRRK